MPSVWPTVTSRPRDPFAENDSRKRKLWEYIRLGIMEIGIFSHNYLISMARVDVDRCTIVLQSPPYKIYPMYQEVKNISQPLIQQFLKRHQQELPFDGNESHSHGRIRKKIALNNIQETQHGRTSGIRDYLFVSVWQCYSHHPDGKQLEAQTGDWGLFDVRWKGCSHIQ